MLLPEEWSILYAFLQSSNAEDWNGIVPSERLLLYATAIQSGLRAGEIRSLTKRNLFLDRKPPFIVAKAAGTKNRKDARQYIKDDLAMTLREHVSKGHNGSKVFRLPRPDQMAEMLREDLAGARAAWLAEAGVDDEEHERRQNSEMLMDPNHAGERLDFHSLRHTCGAWLALAGAHPKAV